jgi:hypothetical protein
MAEKVTDLTRLERVREEKAREAARLRGIAHRLRRLAEMMEAAGSPAYSRKLESDADYLEKKAA